MRRFPRFLGLALLAGVVLLAGSIAIRKLIPDEYIGAERLYLAQLDELLANFDSVATGPRIALVGSSPVMMGLSAQQIEAATGVPTRNLSLDASRSVFQDYAALVAGHVRPGDVVVIANPNLRKSPEMLLPLSCVRHFGLECIRLQNGFQPHIVQDALILFTNRAFGSELPPRTPHGDFIFPEKAQFMIASPKFVASFPRNGVADMVAVAKDVRRHGGCPIFMLTPLHPEPGEVALWESEFTKLWQQIDEAGLRDIFVEDSPLWTERTLFHHDEHPSERGREVWTNMLIAKLQKDGLPASCHSTS